MPVRRVVVVRVLTLCLVGRSLMWLYQNLKNWNLLQSGQVTGTTNVAGKHSNRDAIFVRVWSCCLLPSHRNL